MYLEPLGRSKPMGEDFVEAATKSQIRDIRRGPNVVLVLLSSNRPGVKKKKLKTRSARGKAWRLVQVRNDSL